VNPLFSILNAKTGFHTESVNIRLTLAQSGNLWTADKAFTKDAVLIESAFFIKAPAMTPLANDFAKLLFKGSQTIPLPVLCNTGDATPPILNFCYLAIKAGTTPQLSLVNPYNLAFTVQGFLTFAIFD
jgi:hypothetical protein